MKSKYVLTGILMASVFALIGTSCNPQEQRREIREEHIETERNGNEYDRERQNKQVNSEYYQNNQNNIRGNQTSSSQKKTNRM